jgi:hypothetical protein
VSRAGPGCFAISSVFPLNPARRTGENQSSHGGDGRGSSVAKTSSAWWMSWSAFRVLL